ncbi:hypothetical protein [[Leptolyngbya] sp. PCC 7376]|uniref:hypothetical protein n=1 Tax=[Leptolyngbya] sp. PCC 7376 TaxID=111781 RepID=UPI00135BEA79|nr:hypothetical protein [[Leptolyngbya] sp. PCC 7376]
MIAICEHVEPHIVLLGSLPNSNSLDIYRQCNEVWSDLPIILMADQPAINDHFRDWAMKQGVKEVVSSYPQNFAQLQFAIKEILFPIIEPRSLGTKRKKSNVIPLKPRQQQKSKQTFYQISHREMAISLNELSQFSKTYFGNLAIGNYWRKTQKNLQPNYPALAEWHVDHWGQFDGACFEHKETHGIYLTIEELDSLEVWVHAFTKECERVVVDFGDLIRTHALKSLSLGHLL